MTHPTPFSSTNAADERWSEISEFPDYSISDRGNVMNHRTGKLMRLTRNTRGMLQIGLVRDGTQYKRGIAQLVATAFVSRPREDFDTPIHLDGNRDNLHYANLMWRPLWFARKYMQQFTDNHLTIDTPIEDVEARTVYENSMHAATTHGLIDVDIRLSMLNNTYVWPTGQIFREPV